MHDDPTPATYHCQLSDLTSGTAAPTMADRARQLVLRLLSAAERRVRRWHMRLAGSSTNLLSVPAVPAVPAGRTAPLAHAETTDPRDTLFSPGDRVTVLSLEQIRTTLDARGYCEGLEFMEGMGDLCGRTFTVMKRVRLLYDEGDRRMLRVKRPRYILEGAICHGKNAYDREGCDRSCFFFWSPRWLAWAHGEPTTGPRS